MNKYLFRPARVVQGVRWCVEYYQVDPSTKELKRFREYQQMNRIKDLEQRLIFAEKMVYELNNNLLPHGYPFIEISSTPSYITIDSAVDLSFSIKSRSDRQKTVGTYRTVVNYFKKYLESKSMRQMLLKDFTYRNAMSFMDELIITKSVAPRTYNNYRMFMVSLWNELINRDYITDNVWSRVKKMKVTEKNRHMLSAHDAQVIMSEAYESDKMLFLSIILLYYCFIRPGEQRRMSVGMIDLNSGCISLPGSITKNKKSETITIPSIVIPYLEEIGINNWHRDDYIFGKGFSPHPSIMCGANQFNNVHEKLITSLYKAKRLHNIKGISMYSWKDTGAMALIKAGVDAYEVMRQMRHSDLSITQQYLNSLHTINQSIRVISLILPK